THKLEKLSVRLPAARGREPWASLDAGVFHARHHRGEGDYASLLGGTSDGYLFELRVFSKKKMVLRPRGKPLAHGTIQGLVQGRAGGAGKGTGQGGGHGGGGGFTFYGVGGNDDGMPRTFRFSHGGSSSAVVPGGIPRVDGQLSMVGFGALLA